MALLIGVVDAPIGTSAQQPDTIALRVAVGATSPTTVVQVELLDARLLSGAFLGAAATGFDLSIDGAPPVRVPYTDVLRYWERRRSVVPGMVTVGVLGAGAGALLGALLAATCETCTEDTSPASGALQGGLAVGAVGAAVGAIIGAAIPRWSLRWPSDERPGAAPPSTAPPTVAAPPPVAAPQPGTLPAPASDAGSPAAPRETGELTLQLGGAYGGSEGDPTPPFPLARQRGPMLGVLASLSFRMGIVGFGPEIGWLAGTPGVVTFTGLARLSFGPGDAQLVPYALIGLAGNAWQGTAGAEETLLTVPLGAGATFGRAHRWRAEARWHWLVHHGSMGRPTLLSVSAGRRFVW